MTRDATLLVGLLLLAVACSTQRSDAGERFLSAGFAQRDAWHVFADEPWWALVDMRDMLSLFHPLVVSQTGSAAGAWRMLTIPADWKPPFALRFYCADNYFADPQRHKPGQIGAESFFEHRYKQVLIDDRVVWDRDVIDEGAFGCQTIFQDDITPYVTAGKPFKLTLRIFDKVSTLERNDRDVWFILGPPWHPEGDGVTEQPPRFHTAAWLADPVVGEQAAVEAAPPGARPHEAVVAERHRARWPMRPPGDGMSFPAAFELVTPTDIPAGGFPVTCGLPMPPGAVRDERGVRLQDRSGAGLPLQARAIGRWPDGSVRWLLVNSIAAPGSRAGDGFRLHTSGSHPSSVSMPLRVTRRSGRITISTGALRLVMGRSPRTLLDAVYLPGSRQPVITDLVARMSVLEDGAAAPVRATCQRTEAVETGPVVARVETYGSLDTERRHIGRFVFRLYAYAGLGTVQTNFRIFDDVKPEPYAGTIDDPPLQVSELALVASVPGATGGAMAGMDGTEPVTASGALSLLQDGADHCAVTVDGASPADGRRAQGWIAAGGAGGWVQASVWRFWQQYPKSLSAGDGELRIGLFAPTEAMPLYRPRFGEAKRHDLWLTFSAHRPQPRLAQTLARLADEPPRLFNGDWFCRSGGVNVLDPQWFEHTPQIERWTTAAYGDVSAARVLGQFGIRNFGDLPYGPGQWRNGYYSMAQGALNWGLASGDQRWLERSFEIARHLADVDCVHIAPEHPDWQEWNGLTVAIGRDHSVHGGSAKWAAFQAGDSLVLHYWMTGDPDSLEAAIANADWVVRSEAALGHIEPRSQWRPLLVLLRAWQATGDDRYRLAAARYADPKFQAERVIDWRRGAYLQPTYENWRCVSAGLDSMFAHAVYEYYRLTGDLGAAQMVVAIADSVYDESMLPQEEGLGSFLFYVRYSRGSWYYTQMAELFHMAYDLTGDLRFLRAGRAAFARYLLSAYANGSPMYQSFDNFGWLDPEFGGWQRRFADVPTAPFHITSQTPEPDPAMYAP